EHLVIEREPAPEPCRRSRGVAKNDGDTCNQRRCVGQQEQEDDEKGYPDQHADHERGWVDRQQVVKGRRAFDDLCPVALPVCGRLEDEREREVQHAKENRREAQAEEPLAKAGHWLLPSSKIRTSSRPPG